MKTSDFRRDKNHYVPCLYLKRFAALDERVCAYRTLVSHHQVPLWEEKSINGIAYHRHLYTRNVAGCETDEIERWLDKEFEAPAEEAIQKATTDDRLTRADWVYLVRFLAAQDMRTPASLEKNFKRWGESLPKLMEEKLPESVREFTSAVKSGESISLPNVPNIDYLPLRVTTEFDPDQEHGKVQAEITIGRSLWIYEMRHLLTGIVDVLHQHRWTILRPPKGLNWFTSDAPVIKLNYYGDGKYDFNGGWGSKGTEIILPLSPGHLLYTRIGQRQSPRRGEELPRAKAEMIRKFIAEHAHRMIFATHPDDEIPQLRPRYVSRDAYLAEKERWGKWHEEQTSAEGGDEHGE